MSRKLNFAIIGCGQIAQRHSLEASKLGEIVGVCDIVPEKADRLALQYHTRAFYDFDDLLTKCSRPDVVCICTPNGLHAEQSIGALNSGFNVLCEKPMAIHTADALRMMEAAERNQRLLHIVKQNRFNPPVMAVRDMIAEKKLGRIVGFQINCFWNRPPAYYLDSWHGTQLLDGGILYTQFSHFIDLLYWFLGDLQTASGSRYNLLHQHMIEFEDCGFAILRMKNGIPGSLNYSINSFGKNMEGSFTIFGDQGTVKIGGEYLNELEYFSVAQDPVPQLAKSNAANEYGFYQGSMSNHDKVYATFVRALSDPSYPLVSARDTMMCIDMIEKIYKASPFLS